jgi:hypothetical protein
MQYTSAITTVFLLVFFGMLMRAAQQGQPTAETMPGFLVFRHHILLRGFFVFATFGIPLGLTTLVVAFPPKNQGEYDAIVGLYALSTVLSVLSAVCLWETTRFALVVGPDGLDCRSPWWGRQFIRWNEVDQVAHNPLLGWFVIRAGDGRKFRVSSLVTGLNALLEVCEERLPAKKLTPAKSGYTQLRRPFPEEKG